jgi:hypothetical protein
MPPKSTHRETLPPVEEEQSLMMADTSKVAIEEDYVDPDTLSQKQQ